MIAEAIKKIVAKKDLTFEEAHAVMAEIMDGKSTPTQNAAFLAALSTKSAKAETADEILGCAGAMREKAIPVEHPGMDVLEIVGTGGDHAGAFNISTTSSFVIAAAGAKVAKHGNRAASSACGAADCLEALGVNIHQSPEMCRSLLNNLGICFIFAGDYHTSMKYVGKIRKELGIRTVFNILGPLTNPACPKYYLLGVYDEYLLEPMAKVLERMGASHALVIYGRDGLDEISVSAPTAICELYAGTIKKYDISPKDFGLETHSKQDIIGGSPQYNAQITLDILEGRENGAKRDIVLLNAGAAMYAAGIVQSIAAGVEMAASMIDTGRAANLLKMYIEESNA